jgi:hypothetical protein
MEPRAPTQIVSLQLFTNSNFRQFSCVGSHKSPAAAGGSAAGPVPSGAAQPEAPNAVKISVAPARTLHEFIGCLFAFMIEPPKSSRSNATRTTHGTGTTHLQRSATKRSSFEAAIVYKR